MVRAGSYGSLNGFPDAGTIDSPLPASGRGFGGGLADQGPVPGTAGESLVVQAHSGSPFPGDRQQGRCRTVNGSLLLGGRVGSRARMRDRDAAVMLGAASRAAGQTEALPARAMAPVCSLAARVTVAALFAVVCARSAVCSAARAAWFMTSCVVCAARSMASAN